MEELKSLALEGCCKVTSWKAGDNKLLEGVVDLGRIIGTKRCDGSSTSLLRIILDENRLHTMYPL